MILDTKSGDMWYDHGHYSCDKNSGRQKVLLPINRSQNLRIWEFSGARWGVLSSCKVGFLKVLYFSFLVGYAILKVFSYLFDAKLTSETVSDIFRASPDTAYVNHFFPREFITWFKTHLGETSRPPDFIAQSVTARPHALKLASLTFKNLWEVDL